MAKKHSSSSVLQISLGDVEPAVLTGAELIAVYNES
jgi:hypothetical protein